MVDDQGNGQSDGHGWLVGVLGRSSQCGWPWVTGKDTSLVAVSVAMFKRLAHEKFAHAVISYNSFLRCNDYI